MSEHRYIHHQSQEKVISSHGWKSQINRVGKYMFPTRGTLQCFTLVGSAKYQSIKSHVEKTNSSGFNHTPKFEFHTQLIKRSNQKLHAEILIPHPAFWKMALICI